MRLALITIFIFIQFGLCLGQDGSNINYVKPENLDKDYIGKMIQIDFFRKSFGALGGIGNGINTDKVLLKVAGKEIEFFEHRQDDGYNNWFSEQYLESADKKIKIKEFKLLKIEKETILVKGYLTVSPFTEDFTIKKTEIAEILVSNK